jgi:hypothetical protein
MLRTNIFWGVAAVAICVSALTIVSPSRGEAQIGSTPVRVVNTPLPISGNVSAAVTGNVNAVVTGDVNANVSGTVGLAPGATVTLAGPVTVGNPISDPVLMKNVYEKELWQTNTNTTINVNQGFASIAFPAVPADKALVIEHVSILFQSLAGGEPAPQFAAMNNGSSFSAPTQSDTDYFALQQIGIGYIGNIARPFYVKPTQELRVVTLRTNASAGQAYLSATATGYFVPYP